MAGIKFGTDGWRAIIAEDFTFNNVARVAQATADFWRANPRPGTGPHVVVGYDRRFFSDQFARRASEVFAGNGFQVTLTSEATPTPAVSYAVKYRGAIGGVMITASHNPPIFNGFKLKSYHGASADASICKQVEAALDHSPVRDLSFEEALRAKRIRLVDLRPAHYRGIKSLVDFKLIAGSGLRFAHEALFGVGAGCFDHLLAGTSCKVTTLNGRHDTLFGGINPEPIEKNYALSSGFLRKHPHDICLVTDGDADRIGAMDGRGNSLSTHQIICLLLQHLHTNRAESGRVVKALTTTSMVDKMCAEYGLELSETGVGFKYIAEEMIKGGVLLGAEESGGVGFPGHIPERDGIAAGLFILEMLAMQKQPVTRALALLEKKFGPHRYGRVDTHFPLEARPALMEYLLNHAPARLGRSPLTEVRSYDGVKYVSADTSWLMIRGSGTEPVLRIYAEAADEDTVERLLKHGVKLTQACPAGKRR